MDLSLLFHLNFLIQKKHFDLFRFGNFLWQRHQRFSVLSGLCHVTLTDVEQRAVDDSGRGRKVCDGAIKSEVVVVGHVLFLSLWRSI